jgi:hypothetical protein
MRKNEYMSSSSVFGIGMVVSFALLLGFLGYLLYRHRESKKHKETWSNTYSGWPGPLEMGRGCSSCSSCNDNTLL